MHSFSLSPTYPAQGHRELKPKPAVIEPEEWHTLYKAPVDQRNDI